MLCPGSYPLESAVYDRYGFWARVGGFFGRVVAAYGTVAVLLAGCALRRLWLVHPEHFRDCFRQLYAVSLFEIP